MEVITVGQQVIATDVVVRVYDNCLREVPDRDQVVVNG